MGRQEGLIIFTGSVGNVTFYKNRLYGYLVRKKTGVTRERIMTDPAYVRTRENISEFARGGRATKLMRFAFASVRKFSTDSKVTPRMASMFMKVIKEDRVSARGARHVSAGDLALFEGFNFNANAPLDKTFQARITASIEGATGGMAIDIPDFAPELMIAAPEGATHFRFKSVGAVMNFDAETCSIGSAESSPLALGDERVGPLRLAPTIATEPAHPIMLAFGLEFLQLINGIMVPLADMSFNAMAIVKVHHTRRVVQE